MENVFDLDAKVSEIGPCIRQKIFDFLHWIFLTYIIEIECRTRLKILIDLYQVTWVPTNARNDPTTNDSLKEISVFIREILNIFKKLYEKIKFLHYIDAYLIFVVNYFQKKF